MMARIDAGTGTRPASLRGAVLSVLLSLVLAHVALFGLVRFNIMLTVLSEAGILWGPFHWVSTGRLAMVLLMVIGAIAGVLWLRPWTRIIAIGEARDEDHPETLKIEVMSVLLGFVALMGLGAAAGAVGGALSDPRMAEAASGLRRANLLATLAVLLLSGGGGLWGLARLRPWARRQPVSPSTRKTNLLFGLSGGIATVSCLALILHTMRAGNPAAFFSNGPVALWVALFAIATWLLSWAISAWWYFSADEHERRASDVGLLLGGLMFAAVTPAWWVAARAGLMPQPNAMAIWFAVNLVWGVGWFWRRNR